jgi:hypothetical protein
LFKGGDELLDENLGHLEQGAASHAVLQPTEGGCGSQRTLGVGGALGKSLPEGVVAQSRVVVEILVAQSDAQDALGQQAALAVGDQFGVARVGDDPVERVEQPQALVGLAQQRSAGVGGERAAREVGFEATVAQAGKRQGFCVTPCHRGGWLLNGMRFMLNPLYCQ